MIKDDIQLLFEYDRWANHRVLQAASALKDEQFTQDLGGSFRSVRDTLVHILGGEWDLLTGRRVSYRSILDGFADAARQPFPSGRISQRRCGSDEVGRSRKRANRVREDRKSVV